MTPMKENDSVLALLMAANAGGGGGASSLAGLSDVAVSSDLPYDQGIFLMGNGEKFAAYIPPCVCFSLIRSNNRYKICWANDYYADEEMHIEVDFDWVRNYFDDTFQGSLVLIQHKNSIFIVVGCNSTNDLSEIELKCIRCDRGVGANNETITIVQLRLTDYDEETNTWVLDDAYDPVIIGKPLTVTLTPTAANLSGTFDVPFADILAAYYNGRRIICEMSGMEAVIELSYGDSTALGGLCVAALPNDSRPSIIAIYLQSTNTFITAAIPFVTD